MKSLGSKIAVLATPVARAFSMDCIDPSTKQLRPESTCNQVRIALDEGRYRDAFYDRFFSGKTKKGNMEEYIVTYAVRVGVSAENTD